MWGRLVAVLALVVAGGASAQQIADTGAEVSVARPMYPRAAGPVIAIDGSHNNFHTMEGRYRPFAAILTNDGYRVKSLEGPIGPGALRDVSILVIANPLARENLTSWRLPTPSAFTREEADALKQWVYGGGSLFLIVDHMPFPGAAKPVAEAFGFSFDNSHAVLGGGKEPEFFSTADGTLDRGDIAQGSGPTTAVARVQSFGGSSFRAPSGSTPLVRLDQRWTILTPAKAWEFTPDTPRRNATAEDLRGAALKYGKGRVVVMSEAAMFTAQLAQGVKVGLNAPTAEDNKQFLLNLVHWLSPGSGGTN